MKNYTEVLTELNLDISRLIVCNPIDELFFKDRIKSDDIRTHTSYYLERHQFIMAKDCELRKVSATLGYDNADMANDTVTVSMDFEIW